jgi:D-Tyr-tRNAtyr deacylase
LEKGCYEILVVSRFRLIGHHNNTQTRANYVKECAEDSEKSRIEEIIKLFKKKAEHVHVQDFK